MTDNPHFRQAQISQTRDSFRQALFLLLQEQKLDNIKVSHLAEKAGYARRTFYRHYQEPQDILREELNQVSLQLFQVFSQLPDTSFVRMTEVFFDFWQEKKALLIILKENHIFYWLQQSWTDHIDQSPLLTSRHFYHLYQQQFAIGAMFHLLQAWTFQGFKENPYQMRSVAASIVRELAKETDQSL